MSLKERNYWIEQAKARLLANERRADDVTKELMMLYDEAANLLEQDIYNLFARYAKDNALTTAEAARLLSGAEYSRWRKSMEEYLAAVKAAGNTPEGAKLLLELNTLAMKSRISRKEQLLANVYQNMINLAGDTTARLNDLLGDMLRVNYYEGCWRIQCGVKMAFTVPKISEKLVKSILAYPWAEKHFSQAVWGNCEHLAALARREIALGFIQGSSVDKMAAAIDGVMHKGRYAAERLVRTECKYFANQGELAAYKENGIKQYRFLGGSERSGAYCGCLELNGQIFDVEDAEPGVNFPPMHPNCLCTVVAHFKRSMFGHLPDGATPITQNPNFKQWAKKYAKELNVN